MQVGAQQQADVGPARDEPPAVSAEGAPFRALDPVEVGVDEGIDDPCAELALDVEDEEGDVQELGAAPSIVDQVRYAAERLTRDGRVLITFTDGFRSNLQLPGHHGDATVLGVAATRGLGNGRVSSPQRSG